MKKKAASTTPPKEEEEEENLLLTFLYIYKFKKKIYWRCNVCVYIYNILSFNINKGVT